MATVLDRVRALVERLAPDSICDDHIAERISLTVRQYANHKTRALAGRPGFERPKDNCSLCGHIKLVIRKKAPVGLCYDAKARTASIS